MPQNPTAKKDRAARYGQLRYQAAFTLIELLVVIALTGLLLTLLLGPLIQGFNLTNRARALAEAQDASRFGIEQLKRELSQAAYVFDNSTAAIVLPFSGDANDARAQAYPNVYSAQPGNPQPSVIYAKIDFIPAATAGEGPTSVIDPTTGKPLGGTPIVLPLSPGRRYVRYFIGLREPFKKDATGRYTGPNYYSNPFEFKRTDTTFNSFILWRAEYDPRDPNLVDPNANAYTINGGGLHDPNFFYNGNVAPNGRTFAENWRVVAQPVLSAPNLDLIAWRKNQAKELVSGSPFQILALFNPTSVAGETGTPGFLSNTAGGQAGAVPSIYSTQFGQWTYPYTITVYRGSAQGRPGSARFGQIQFTVEQLPDVNLNTRLRVTLGQGVPTPVSGTSNDSLDPATDNSYYWLLDQNTGKVFIYTGKLAFQVDSSRGRIETAFPPLAMQNGTNEAIPLYRDVNGNLRPMDPGPNGNYGSLIPTVFRQNTRRPDAGTTIGSSIVPVNAGLFSTTLDLPLYYEATAPMLNFTNPGTAYPSPFQSLMGRAWQSIIITPTSEKVQGPDASFSVDPNSGKLMLSDYARIPIIDVGTSIGKKVNQSGNLFIRSVPPDYQLDVALDNYNKPLLRFDDTPTTAESSLQVMGLPAKPANNASLPEGELRVTYFWQSNFARDAAGRPVNAFGEYIGSNSATLTGVGTNHAIVTANDYKPELDVIKVDYSTRTRINVQLGARVYDTSSGQPQTASVNNHVTVGNVAR